MSQEKALKVNRGTQFFNEQECIVCKVFNWLYVDLYEVLKPGGSQSL